MDGASHFSGWAGPFRFRSPLYTSPRPEKSAGVFVVTLEHTKQLRQADHGNGYSRSDPCRFDASLQSHGRK